MPQPARTGEVRTPCTTALSARLVSAGSVSGRAPAGTAGAGDTTSANRPRAAAPVEDLIERLRASTNAKEAEPLAQQIIRRWRRSGSATAELLLTRARTALGKQDAALAIEIADRLIALQPAWVEAWHLRGLAQFTLGDDERALADLRQALRLEPRHFLALGVTAAALQRQGDLKAAFRAFRAARDVHPHLPGVSEAIERLRPDVEGRDA